MNQAASSEFEKERQRILAEIEARALKAGGTLTLQQWLKAAEEVMPDEAVRVDEQEDTIVSLSESAKKRFQKTDVGTHDKQPNALKKEEASMTAQQRNTPDPSRKTVFFAFLIGTVVVLLLVAVGGLGYMKLNRQLQALSDSTAQLQSALQQMEQRLNHLEKQGGVGDGDRLEDLMARIQALETQRMPEGGHDSQQVVTDQVRAELSNANVITEAVLDAKLERFSQRIEQVIDKRFATILAQIKNLRSQQREKQVGGEVSLAPEQDETEGMAISTPNMPSVPVQPVVQQPEQAVSEKQDMTRLPGEAWLSNQPGAHWTLQLASVLDRDSLIQLKRNKQLDDAHIVRQLRSGRTFYVLVLGSYADKAAAREAAQSVKVRTGINPWVRPIRDLQKGLPE